MQDLTTGSVTRHLLKTTSFMLVTMVFQTLYFLVDLYWVGRLGKEAVAGVGIAGNLTFIVLAITQMLGVGTTTLVSHAAGRKDRDRALLVFNQSQVLSVVVGAALLRRRHGAPHRRTRTRSRADARTAALAADYLAVVHPGDGAAVRDGRDGRGAARHRQLQAGHDRPDRHGDPEHGAGAVPDLRLGHAAGRSAWPARRSRRSSRSRSASVWLTFYFLPKDSYLKFMAADWKPRLRTLEEDARDRPAGRRGVRADRRLPVRRLRRSAGRSARRRRPGSASACASCRPASCRSSRSGFAVAPVAGQNFGARQAERVRATFRSAVADGGRRDAAARRSPAAIAAPRWSGSSRATPQVVAVGAEYLRIVSWNFVASGVIFVGSSMFQAMGNTLPALMASFARIVIVAVPAFLLSRLPGFHLHWIWYLSVVAITVQLALNLLLLRREFRRRLTFAPA